MVGVKDAAIAFWEHLRANEEVKRRCQDRVEFAHEWQRWRAEQRERAGTSYAGTDAAVLRELVQALRVATA